MLYCPPLSVPVIIIKSSCPPLLLFCSPTMDHDNGNFQPHTPSSAVSKTSDNAASVVRQRPRAASTRHRHTTPAHIHPDDLAGLRISHAFREFTVAPVITAADDSIGSSTPSAGDIGSPTPTLLVASERLGLLPCQPPNLAIDTGLLSFLVNLLFHFFNLILNIGSQ